MKTKKISRENPYLRRAFLYLPISIMSITYGILHALKIHAVPIKLIICIKYPLLAVPLLLDAILFLTFYTQTFRGSEKLPTPPIKMGTQNSIGYVCSVQMLVLIAISSCYSLAYALVVACFSVITVISCILMNKKANEWANKENPLKQQKVRLELIWPSLYIVGLSIVCGYFLVISESSSINLAAGIPIVLPMGMATLYSITMFWAEDYKRKKKEALHPAHLFFLILVFVFALLKDVVKIPLNNEETLLPFQYMGLVAWAVVISSVFAQFEAWAVVERRRNDKTEIRRYIRSANIVTVALLVFIPIIYIFSSGANISPIYMMGFCFIGCTYLAIRIFYCNRQTEDNNEYIPNEKSVRRIKILLTAVCTILLVISELLTDDKVAKLTKIFSDNIPTVIYILSSFPMVGLILQQIIKKEPPINILNIMFNLSYYETTKNLCKQVLYWSSSGALVCFIATLVIRESIGQTGDPFSYKLSVVCMHYISVAFLCLLIIVIEFIKKD